MEPSSFSFNNSNQSGQQSNNIARAPIHRRARNETFNIYINKVLKQVHPEMGLLSAAMRCMDSFCKDMFEKFADEASNLVYFTKKSSLTAREMQTATQLVLPGELAKHAISEGTKSLNKYLASMDGGSHSTETKTKIKRISKRFIICVRFYIFIIIFD